jgi:hypothetical protein
MIGVAAYPPSSSQRKLGSILTLEPLTKSKIKMGPSFRWDDGTGVTPPLAATSAC